MASARLQYTYTSDCYAEKTYIFKTAFCMDGVSPPALQGEFTYSKELVCVWDKAK